MRANWPAMKRVLITGGSGFIGQKLAHELLARGDQVTVLTRDPRKARAHLPAAVRCAAWDPDKEGAWFQELEVVDADPDADFEGLRRLTLWAGQRYSPVVAPDPHTPEARARHRPGSLLKNLLGTFVLVAVAVLAAVWFWQNGGEERAHLARVRRHVRAVRVLGTDRRRRRRAHPELLWPEPHRGVAGVERGHAAEVTALLA